MSHKPPSAISRDAYAMMTFQSCRKSAGIAYLFWLLLGGLGAHRFYLGRTGSGIGLMLCTLSGALLLLPLVATAIWVLVDLFLIPDMTREENGRLMGRIQAGQAR